MYTLTLTAAERKAIDWVGHRYPHGNDLYKLLWRDSEQSPDDADWDADCDITFHITEPVAWAISAMGDDCEYQWACFADNLSRKLNDFCMAVV